MPQKNWFDLLPLTPQETTAVAPLTSAHMADTEVAITHLQRRKIEGRVLISFIETLRERREHDARGSRCDHSQTGGEGRRGMGRSVWTKYGLTAKGGPGGVGRWRRLGGPGRQ